MSTYFTALLGYILLSTASVVSGLSNQKTTINSSCVAPCSCCLESAQCNTSIGFCNDQCKDGNFGWRCKVECPSNCVRCKDVPEVSYLGRCTECKSGYYSTKEYYQCQFNCAPTCQTCTSASVCTLCKTGYVLHNGQCTVCRTGCASCSSYNDCDKCQDGYYNSGGVTGKLHCVACSNGCTDQCDNTTGVCKCTDKSGSCSCKHGFDGDKCDRCAQNVQLFPNCSQCVAGYFGTSCDKICPENCREHVCRMLDGTCTQGCVENFIGESCTNCVLGRFGRKCSDKCPENCGGTCDETSGYCHTCKTFFSGYYCDGCMTGKYGRNCTFTCPSGCKHSCDKETGNCASCMKGRYGNVCQNICSEHCVNGTCRLESGACYHGCMSGYSGDQCCMKGTTCKKCSLAQECIICQEGFYGIDCGGNCSTNCIGNICERNYGTCVRCVHGYHGQFCQLRISTNQDNSEGLPVAVIAGLITVFIVVLLVVILKKRIVKCLQSCREQIFANPTYVNELPICQNDSRSNTRNVNIINRKLKLYQQKEVRYGKKRVAYGKKETEYAEKVSQLQYELSEITSYKGYDGATFEVSGDETFSNYETLDSKLAGDNPYADIVSG